MFSSVTLVVVVLAYKLVAMLVEMLAYTYTGGNAGIYAVEMLA